MFININKNIQSGNRQGNDITAYNQYNASRMPKNKIDLQAVSGYNVYEVIYLLGMAFAFPNHK